MKIHNTLEGSIVNEYYLRRFLSTGMSIFKEGELSCAQKLKFKRALKNMGLLSHDQTTTFFKYAKQRGVWCAKPLIAFHLALNNPLVNWFYRTTSVDIGTSIEQIKYELTRGYYDGERYTNGETSKVIRILRYMAEWDILKYDDEYLYRQPLFMNTFETVYAAYCYREKAMKLRKAFVNLGESSLMMRASDYGKPQGGLPSFLSILGINQVCFDQRLNGFSAIRGDLLHVSFTLDMESVRFDEYATVDDILLLMIHRLAPEDEIE